MYIFLTAFIFLQLTLGYWPNSRSWCPASQTLFSEWDKKPQQTRMLSLFSHYHKHPNCHARSAMTQTHWLWTIACTEHARTGPPRYQHPTACHIPINESCLSPCYLPINQSRLSPMDGHELVMSHVNESCHTCMTNVTFVNESCNIYGWVMSDMWTSQVTYERVTLHMNESCHTNKWVMF